MMETNVAPGGLICVIDTDTSAHDQLQSMGFHRSTHLTLLWSESGPRELDPTTSHLLFGEAGIIVGADDNRKRVVGYPLSGSLHLVWNRPHPSA